jgi:hypothetical protein
LPALSKITLLFGPEPFVPLNENRILSVLAALAVERKGVRMITAAQRVLLRIRSPFHTRFFSSVFSAV